MARLDRFGAIAANLGEMLAGRLIVKVAERLAVANQTPIYHVGEGSLAWTEQGASEASLEDRLEIINRIMRSPIDCGRVVDISLNFGIASMQERTVEQALTSAGQAADYAANKTLRWHYFDEADEVETDWHLSLLSELDAAMTSGQLWNVYQPKLNLATGRIVGAEALVRWLHPTRGQIAPSNFIPLLEKHGRDRDIMLHVVARAIEDAAQWESSRLDMGIAINVAPALLRDAGFMDQVAKMLQHSSMSAERITIELSAMVEISEADIEAMRGWRATGVGLSIGDGDSSLTALQHLHRLPVNELKIDQNLVRDLACDDFKAAVVRSTIEVAHKLGIKVIAEGIEDAECLRVLKDMRCDAGQGYYIGRPMSAANFRVFLGGSSTQAA